MTTSRRNDVPTFFVLLALVALFAGCGSEPAPNGEESVTSSGETSAESSAPESAQDERLEPVEEGEEAPDFALPASTGEEIRLSELQGRPVVLYFYPKNETPGCTKQACGLRDVHAELEELDAQVLGVSLDDVESHRAFIENHQLNFPLLADSSGTVSALYGVLGEFTLPGDEEPTPIAKRTTFLIDAEGRVARVWREVDVTTHADEVLGALREL